MDKKIRRVAQLLSGGMDSTTILGYLIEKGWEIYPIGVNYGQLHLCELDSANDVVKYYQKAGANVHDLKVLKLDLTQIGGSALTDENWKMPGMKDQIKTVVPWRNTLLSTLACAYASTLGIYDLFIGPCREDREAYRDCRKDFYKSLNQTLSLGYTYPKHVRVIAPYIDEWKRNIIREGMKFKIPTPYKLSHSCYLGLDPGCPLDSDHRCPACIERTEGFKQAGFEDPIFK